ncbi:uncharacterized protein LOC112505427, partial [Cynara cardunculus var. scolymus]|uniref:uncharacterized protein LOC112505427 n=1 Tax=Cynara cardunculus var. scolymus TaxID=59895 RepID=UPI000D62414A
MDLQRRLEKEFWDLKQGTMTVMEYETEFNRKLGFAQRFLSTEDDKVERFEGGLQKEIQNFLVNREVPSFAKAVEFARRCDHDLSIPDDPVPAAKRPCTGKTNSVPTHRPPKFLMSRRRQMHNTARATSQAYSLQSNAPRICQRCGKNHTGRCNIEPSSVRCFCCGEVGHVRAESKASVQRPTGTTTSVQKEEVPKARVRAFQITAEEACNEPNVVTESMPSMLDEPFTVSTFNEELLDADKVYKDCLLILHDYKFLINLIPMDIHGFDIVIGMDWLAKNHAHIICAHQMIRIEKDDGDYLYVYWERRVDGVKVISMLKARQYLIKGCSSFLAYVLDSSKEVKKTVKDVPIVCEYPDVFPDDLPGLPPDRQVEFQIDLVPGASPIAKTPYRLAPAEMKEMMNQLQDLLDKGFIRPSASPWGVPILFVKKKDGSFRMCIDYRELNKIEALKPENVKLERMVEYLDSLSEDGSGLKIFKTRIWVPRLAGMRDVVLTEAHKSRLSIHPGSTKMYQDLRLDYWWPGMKTDIGRYVKKCTTCLQ